MDKVQLRNLDVYERPSGGFGQLGHCGHCGLNMLAHGRRQVRVVHLSLQHA